MNDKKKVVAEIEKVIRLGERWDEAYRMIDIDLLRKTVELLKDQEPKLVDSIQKSGKDCTLTGYCPTCERPLKEYFNACFCGDCGQVVRWE